MHASSADPFISVIMATYNCESTVEEAVMSILAQTYDKWEFIICDDCSTDKTFEVLNRISVNTPQKITLLRNDANRKLAFSLNRCLEYAEGELIARMDGDDISLPERFDRQVEYLRENPHVDLVGTAMRRFNERGLADVVSLPESPDRYTLHKSLPFAHATIMARRTVFSVLGNYTVSKRTERAEDYDLWFRFFKAGFKGRNLPSPLYLVREDLHAIRRRTPLSRYYAFRIALDGYRSLDYPCYWRVTPALALLKGLVPARFVRLFRRYQSAKYHGAIKDEQQ